MDAAWDVAAAIIELALDAPGERLLLGEYRAASGDQDVEERLRFMRPAYAAFRLGYTRMAADALGNGNDGRRMRSAATRYAAVLRRALSAENIDGQSCATGM
jgi:hypothetical protein